MDQMTIERLTSLMREKICSVCIDRNPDGSCDRREEGRCTLMEKLPLAAEVVLQVHSDRMEPYIEAIRTHLCSQCDHRYPDGSCAPRETDQCMLNSYLPLVVEAIEEHFQRAFPPLAELNEVVRVGAG